ncbi:hypothetical protein [Arthrobacter sp. RIT-PI-e]|uniref:hypothetical protein n=1 Tax=Arthrobacter sp. RIT-PI-e TaxID=1681197 RepID=UPI000675F88F|nr:hypothetical protein [Arthrobacter sp. RIT-PI-e]
MSGLFSHSPTPDSPVDSRADVVSDVVVPAPGEHAWAGFTEHLHLWWPAALLSRWGESSFFDLEDNALVETSAEDDEYVWGEVTSSAAGQWLELRWRHAGSTSTTTVRAELGAGAVEPPPEMDRQASAEETDGASSTLTLTHSGWTSEDPAELYTSYREFWPEALSRYRRFMGGS